MRATQWYQSFEKLMRESTYWSWVAELWNWTSMEQCRERFLNVIIWLASGKIKEGELMEKLDWKRLENRFRSCWILGCVKQVWQGDSGYLSLGNWMGDDPLFIGNQMECPSVWNDEFWREIVWSSKQEKVWLLIWSKLIQNACFIVKITSGSSLNMFRSKNTQKQSV